MSKKLLCVTMLMLVLVCALASCGECKHELSDATCMYDGICEKCGVTVGSGLGHNYSEWTDTTTCLRNGVRERTCKRCGEKESEIGYARGYHNFGGWSTTAEANCIQAGLEERICSDCGEKETNSFPKKDYHRYDNFACLDCGDTVLVCFSTPSMPMKVTNICRAGSEEYIINKMDTSVISWNLDGTCTVEISMDAEKTFEYGGHYMKDEISITITDSNGETMHKAISLSKKSITLTVDASLNYYIHIEKTNLYV